MIEYPKTENVFTRNEETHKLNLWDLRVPEHAQIRDWVVTEKIDGTNMRVTYTQARDEQVLPDTKPYPSVLCAVDAAVTIQGRSANAQIPKPLLSVMEAMFKVPQFEEVFADTTRPITLYGEGYGPGIQKGGYYRSDPSFILFDIYSGDSTEGKWLDWADVVDVGEKLGINVVPDYGRMTLEEIVHLVQTDEDGYELTSQLAHRMGSLHPAEGIVARTDPYLYDWRGHLIKFKLKAKDL